MTKNGGEMAMMETKVVQVQNDPEILNQANEVWGSFGWNVMSVQVTHTQNTKTYTKGMMDYYSGDKTVETTTINYATVTYQRDKEMQGYREVVALEQAFNAEMQKLSEISSAQENTPTLGKKVATFFILYVVIIALAGMIGGTALVVLGSWVYCIGYAVYAVKNKKKEKEQIQELLAMRDQCEKKLDEIRFQAEQKMSA